VAALKLSEEKKALGAQGASLPPTTDELRPGSVTEPPHRCSFTGCPGHNDKSYLCYTPDPPPRTASCCFNDCSSFQRSNTGFPCGNCVAFRSYNARDRLPENHHCCVNCLSCGAYLEFWFLPGNIVLHCVQRLGSPLQVMSSVGMKDDMIHCWRCANKYFIYYTLNPARKTDEAPEEEMAEEGVPAPPKLPDR